MQVTLMEAGAVTAGRVLTRRMPVASTWVGAQASWEGAVYKALLSSRQRNCTELSRAFPKVFFEKLETYKGEPRSFYLNIGIVPVYVKARNIFPLRKRKLNHLKQEL